VTLDILPDPGEPGRFRLLGELDLATAHSLVTATAQVIEDVLVDDVVLDLQELAFMDSSGISALINISGRLRRGSLVLLQPQPHVARVLRLVRADAFPSVRIVWDDD